MDYLQWTSTWIESTKRVLTNLGSLFLNVGDKPTQPWTAIDIALEARRHLVLQNTIHWIKSIVIDKDLAGNRAGLERDLAIGHYKPINSQRFLNNCHEFIFHLTPSGHTPLDRKAIGVPYQDPSNIERWKTASGGLRCRGNNWFIPYTTIQSRERDRPHPATFPPLLPECCLRIHGLQRTRVVMDPFMGLGSTAVACAKLGVDFIGIEMDRAYLDEAVERAKETLDKTRRKT
jgi:site-specific DNA-methyltransferase (adenine-specific)